MKTVSCIVYKEKNNKRQFLLLKRVKAKGDFWQFVGGKIEPNEEIGDALLREIKEETSIGMKDLVCILLDKYEFEIKKHYLTGEVLKTPTHETVFCIRVRCKSIVDITKDLDLDHEAYGWFDYDVALKMLKWKDNKNALKHFKKILIG